MLRNAYVVYVCTRMFLSPASTTRHGACSACLGGVGRVHRTAGQRTIFSSWFWLVAPATYSCSGCAGVRLSTQRPPTGFHDTGTRCSVAWALPGCSHSVAVTLDFPWNLLQPCWQAAASLPCSACTHVTGRCCVAAAAAAALLNSGWCVGFGAASCIWACGFVCMKRCLFLLLPRVADLLPRVAGWDWCYCVSTQRASQGAMQAVCWVVWPTRLAYLQPANYHCRLLYVC